MCVYLRLVGPYDRGARTVSIHHWIERKGQRNPDMMPTNFNSLSKRTCTHNPLAILTRTHALTRFFELEILQELDATGVVWVFFETSFSLPGKPFR